MSKPLGFFVALTGISVIFGWVFDIPTLTSILPHWVTMKFTTAFCFVMSGMILAGVSCKNSNTTCHPATNVMLPFFVMIIFMFMITLLLSSLIGVRTGIEDFFVKESLNAVKTSTPGRPSIGTIFAFLSHGTIGLYTMFFQRVLKKTAFLIVAVFNILLGSIALFGYLLNKPVLYYMIKNFSSAMAFHTALLFIILGTGYLFLFLGILKNEK